MDESTIKKKFRELISLLDGCLTPSDMCKFRERTRINGEEIDVEYGNGIEATLSLSSPELTARKVVAWLKRVKRSLN